MNSAFKGVLSSIFVVSLLTRSSAAFKNPYTLADLVDVASIFMVDPLAIDD